MSIKLSGEGAILLSAAAYALSAGMIKNNSKDENPVVLSGYQFFLGGIILVVVGIATGGKIFRIYSRIYRTSYIYGDDFSRSIYFVGNIA